MSSDLSKPNHYFDDSLGDPATCTGDHNHPDRGLSEAARKAAENATCTRCWALMLQVKGSGRLTTGTWRLVGQKGIGHFNLCSGCGREFRLFLAGEGDF